jgi:hypothetical protein
VVSTYPSGKMMELKSVGMMKFTTEWKVIKFHGCKPPTSYDLRIETSSQWIAQPVDLSTEQVEAWNLSGPQR